MGVPPNGWSIIMENPIRINDFGGTPRVGNLFIVSTCHYYASAGPGANARGPCAVSETHITISWWVTVWFHTILGNIPYSCVYIYICVYTYGGLDFR